VFTLHCSIFKMLFAAVSDSFNIISQVLKFVKHFFQNFLISFIAVFRFPTNSHSVSFQQLYYSIIKFLVCQVLFLKFFQLLSFTRFRPLFESAFLLYHFAASLSIPHFVQAFMRHFRILCRNSPYCVLIIIIMQSSALFSTISIVTPCSETSSGLYSSIKSKIPSLSKYFALNSS